MTNYSPSGEWDTSSLWNKWTFSVVNELMSVGTSRVLEYDDLLQVPIEDRSTRLMRTLKRNYRNSQRIWFIPRLMVALLKTTGAQNIFLIILCIMSESAFRVVLPISLIYLLTALQSGTSGECYMWAAILSGLGLVRW